MKKIFTLLLTAMVSMSVNAQDFADYASAVGQSYNQLSRQFSDLEELFQGYYSCTPDDGKTESLLIAFNDDLEAYVVMQSLLEGAYTLDQIVAYMDSKYTKYEPGTNEYTDEETGEIISSTTYYYGNTAEMEEATLLISFGDNTSVTYTNPQAAPEPAQGGGIGEITPIEAVNAFLGETIEGIEDEYPGMFTEMFGSYAAFASEEDMNEYLEGIVLLPDENGAVSTIRLLYVLGDDEVAAYYTENGYTCTDNGTVEEEGETYKKYIITNGNITIDYMGGTGTVTAGGETSINAPRQAGINGDWHTLGGNRLNTQPTKKGLYIHGDRKVIIK